MSDMGWLKTFVDERIAASHRETSAAPNTAHGAVVVDRFGHVVSGMPGSGGGGTPQIIKYRRTSSQSISSGGGGTNVEYDTLALDNTSGQVTTFPSWEFAADPESYYVVRAGVMWAAKSWAAGIQTALWVNVGGSLYNYLDQQFHAQGGSSNRLLHGMCIIDTLGQTLPQSVTITAFQDSGVSVNLDSGWGQSTFVDIWKLG